MFKKEFVTTPTTANIFLSLLVVTSELDVT